MKITVRYATILAKIVQEVAQLALHVLGTKEVCLQVLVSALQPTMMMEQMQIVLVIYII
jgi:hypothetical protein